MDRSLEAWTDFNVAVAGATAALAGLLIVAMSVNIDRILADRGVSARAASTVGALAVGLSASCLALAPGQPLWALGLEILAGTIFVAVLAASAVRRIYSEDAQTKPMRPVKAVPCMVPPVLFGIGAVGLIIGRPAGYDWVAAGSVTALLAGVIFSWVALIEVLR